MRGHPWTLWTVAVLVAAAAATKMADADRFAADLFALIADAGLPSPPADAAPVTAWVLIVVEVALAVAIVVPRTSRAALLALLAVIVAGVALVGPASDWGRRIESVCPCRIEFVAPFLRSGFAMLLVRDACIVALVAMAWRTDEATLAPSPG